MKVYTTHDGGHSSRVIKAWVDGVEFEDEAYGQVRNLASLPFIFKHVAVMPDVHWGMGATIGSVFASKGAIIPAAVGVDIGCGMRAQKLTLKPADLPDNLDGLRSRIEQMVPHGRTNNGGAMDRGAWGETPGHVECVFVEKLQQAHAAIVMKHPKADSRNVLRQLGTLGTGNHFIEVCEGDDGFIWVVLHSGSRGAGNRIGMYFTDFAKKAMDRWRIELPDKNLAYLPEGEDGYRDYIRAVTWAQEYARLNRELMMERVIDALVDTDEVPDFTRPFGGLIDCHHNYLSMEHHFGQNVWVTRKGAVRAREGDRGIIPGSMGARSYIVSGLGNPDSFHSCSHGAGRRMSRRKARDTISVEDHRRATEGVSCRKDETVLDESPAAYKDIDAVMAAQEDLVKVDVTLKQLICVKG